jgi:hypothetical protein
MGTSIAHEWLDELYCCSVFKNSPVIGQCPVNMKIIGTEV